ncbi:RES family NAD+ phosphorylase [Rhizobium ruizarguesonis]|nr:RES family NAD+ phosphorylase [Rhizobium ruizarguesonis]
MRTRSSTRPRPISPRNDARQGRPAAPRRSCRHHRLCQNHLARSRRDASRYGLRKTRFSSPRDKFRLLYLAQDPATAIAETIVRDRFQGKAERLILREEFDRYSIAVIRNPSPLFLLDLRYEGANLLGVSTDAVRARAQTSGRRLSQEIYDRTDFDGILYMSRITNKQCVAVYDRATASIEADGPAWDLIRLSALGPILDALHLTVIGGGMMSNR